MWLPQSAHTKVEQKSIYNLYLKIYVLLSVSKLKAHNHLQIPIYVQKHK